MREDDKDPPLYIITTYGVVGDRDVCVYEDHYFSSLMERQLHFDSIKYPSSSFSSKRRAIKGIVDWKLFLCSQIPGQKTVLEIQAAKNGAVKQSWRKRIFISQEYLKENREE